MDTSTQGADHFGVHLTIDGYGGNNEWLHDEAKVLSLLKTLPEKLHMHTIDEPRMVSVPKLSEKDPGGISGFVMIAESHISLHTFPDRGFVSADVYTCQKDLDKETVLAVFKETFDLQELETNYIIRGLKYPKENIY